MAGALQSNPADLDCSGILRAMSPEQESKRFEHPISRYLGTNGYPITYEKSGLIRAYSISRVIAII